MLPTLLRALDLCVVERVRSESPGLRLLTPAPTWLSGVFEKVPAETGQLLGDAIPFLDHFLPQAEAAWDDGQDAVASTSRFATTVLGEEVLLVATAMCHQNRRLLILRRLTGEADLQPMLQRAREKVLGQERLVRQITELHQPCASIDRVAKALVAASLSPDHHALAERLSQASAEVQAVLATLPSPRSRPRRQTR